MLPPLQRQRPCLPIEAAKRPVLLFRPAAWLEHRLLTSLSLPPPQKRRARQSDNRRAQRTEHLHRVPKEQIMRHRRWRICSPTNIGASAHWPTAPRAGLVCPTRLIRVNRPTQLIRPVSLILFFRGNATPRKRFPPSGWTRIFGGINLGIGIDIHVDDGIGVGLDIDIDTDICIDIGFGIGIDIGIGVDIGFLVSNSMFVSAHCKPEYASSPTLLAPSIPRSIRFHPINLRFPRQMPLFLYWSS